MHNRSSLIDQCGPCDAEGKKKPCEHDSAGGNQGVMDARPSTAHAVAPEQCGHPYARHRTENAKPCERVEHNQRVIKRVIEYGGIDAAPDEEDHGRNDDG